MHDRQETAVATPFGACEPMRSACGPARWLTAVVVLLLAHAELAPAQTDARALACAARVRQVADELLGVRTQALRACVEAALSCTTPFATPGAQAPACNPARSNRCQRRLQRIERKNARIATVARRCFGTVASPRARDALLGDDGQALASLAPFCPTVVIRPESVDDALACQRVALGCTAAAAIARLAPRAPELLALLGAPDDAPPIAGLWRRHHQRRRGMR
jgi:hypothetical protein